MSPEEEVIREWLAGQLSASGAPLAPSRRLSQPLPRRQVTAVVATLIELLDEARKEASDRCDHQWGGAYTEVVHKADDAGYVDLPDGRSVAVGRGHTLTVALPVPGTFACSRCGRVRDDRTVDQIEDDLDAMAASNFM